MTNRHLVCLLVLVCVSIAAADPGARYLIVAPDAFVEILRPLADWKTQKGMLARIVPLSITGSDPNQIQTYIRDAYSTWPIPPEYVLIAGSANYIRAFNDGVYHDCGYGDMGGDYKMELPVGRLPFETARECSTMVAKTLAYERPTGDTGWAARAATVVREDNDPADDSIYWNDSRLLHRYLISNGAVRVDSLSRLNGHNSGDVDNAAREGRGFLTYRGQGVSSWWSPFNTVNPSGWNNGGALPVVVGGTCATMTLYPGESMYGDQFVRAGSTAGLGGAICYFGTTASGSNIARARSNCYRGFVSSLFFENSSSLGYATLGGRAATQSSQSRYLEWNLFGDPELNVWTRAPRAASVEHPAAIVMAPQDFQIAVTSEGQAVQGVWVCAWLDSVVYAWGVTNAAGRVTLAVNPTHLGEMLVTVTGQNLMPYEGSCQVTAGTRPYLVTAGELVEDYVGNHDGIVNPGERAWLTVSLHNIGQVSATGVEARLATTSPSVLIDDSLAAYGTILPDSTAAGDRFALTVDTTGHEGDPMELTLTCWDAEGDTWQHRLDLSVRGGRVVLVEVRLFDDPPGGDGNGRLSAGESGRLELRLVNAGGGPLRELVGVLRSDDSSVLVVDSTGFYGWAGVGETLAGATDRFAITAGPGLNTTQPARLGLGFAGSGGTYRYHDTTSFEVEVDERGMTTEPTGPDSYGYWCYDNTDSASGRAPTYDWFELEGRGHVIDSVSDLDAATVTRPLPFTFRYYGQDYNFISICSNGFLAPGYTTYRSGYNRPLPDTGGAPGTIAPFWDDLNPDESRNGNGTAYEYFDTTRHRYIVEFKEFSHNGQRQIRETFQAVLHDPAHYPTPTGDGDIVCLYNRVALNSGCTVGIENRAGTIGLQYLYNNQYPPTAPFLQAGRALRFTTLPPVGSSLPWLVVAGVVVTDSAGNGNGTPEPGEPLAARVTIRNLGPTAATDVNAVLRSLDPDAGVVDSFAGFGHIPAGGQAGNATQPYGIGSVQSPTDSILDFELVITATGYTTVAWFSVGLANVTGLESAEAGLPRVTELRSVAPNPCPGRALVRFGLPAPAGVDLALFDPAGRQVVRILRGRLAAGWYTAPVDARRLSQGVYFCRLVARDRSGEHRLVRKLQVVRH